MKIELHPSFEKAFKKRISWNKKLVLKVNERITLFMSNPHYSVLENHKLSGKQTELRAFSINGDIRIVYFEINEDHVLFLDIGSHNQVY